MGKILIRKTVGLHMPHRHPHQNPAYRNLLAFIVSLSYTDFRTITCEEVEILLREAEVDYTIEGYVIDKYPYTAYGPSLDCKLIQETGHQNKLNFAFDENGVLLTFQLYTSLK